MATAASAWAKPGAWALDSEEHEAELLIQQEKERENGHLEYETKHTPQQQPLLDFPSLATAAATKTKKKKAQTLSLSEFTTGKQVTYGAAKAAQTTQAKGLTADEILVLPTGPRVRSEEELSRSSSRLGGGFQSYGSGDNGRSRYSNSDDSSNGRWVSSRVSDEPRRNGGFNRESAPSRADEIDDWGATKKSVTSPGFERKERGGGFFDSQSRADESDSWLSKKSSVYPEPRRIGGGGGFENHRERRGFEVFQKETSNGGGADSDSWGKKREEVNGNGRPRLVLQPRKVPLSNDDQQQQPGSGSTTRTKGSNPFGDARPREEILAEKGQDWKKIDEQLESIKIKEMGSVAPASSDGPPFGKKGFGTGIGRASVPDDRTERNWRKTELVDVPSPSAERADENGGVAET